MPEFNIKLDNSYFRNLPGLYTAWKGDPAPQAKVLRLNHALAHELGLTAQTLAAANLAQILCGAEQPADSTPLAMAYAGHQFGGYSARLGDGRALLVGEIIDADQQRRDLHLKGSGKTPFSRGGDGKAALKPVLREYLIGEAMHALAIPTTRALAAVTTGEQVFRETPQPGAVLARIAGSHLRVGSFQYAAASGDTPLLRKLADYAIWRHYPQCQDNPQGYLELLRCVVQAQARLVAQWMLVGFVHGVMNTDNMTISGETIDYGPCAFMDTYHPKTVFSSIDHQGRYAYGSQPGIAAWNLARFAETLLPLIAEDPEQAIPEAVAVLETYPEHYEQHYVSGMRAKLGLHDAQPEDAALIDALTQKLTEQRLDFTQFFRALADFVRSDSTALDALGGDMHPWLTHYQQRIDSAPQPATERAAAMDRVNPYIIPRNHHVEHALDAAQGGDMSAFDQLLEALSDPFTQRQATQHYSTPAPAEFGRYVTYCGT